MALTIVGAYDVSADHRRARIAALMQTHGDRLQKSVFLLRIDADGLAELRANIDKILDHRTDSVYLVPVCATCWSGHQTVGQAHVERGEVAWAVF